MSKENKISHNNDHMSMDHCNGYDLCRIEYREIHPTKDGKDGEYITIGDEAISGKIDEALKAVVKVQMSNFPPQCRANVNTHLPSGIRSKLSINFNNDKCLYVFKLSDASDLEFDTSSHAFQVPYLNNHTQAQREKLKHIFSDGQVLSPQWACFVFNGEMARPIIEGEGLKLAFHFHTKEKVPKSAVLPHPPYWPPHPPNMY